MKALWKKLFGGMLAFALIATPVFAANWTTLEGGSQTCASIYPGGMCYLQSGSATSSVVQVDSCSSVTVTVYGTSEDVMPQTCSDFACTNAEDMANPTLDGDYPNVYWATLVPFRYVRVVAATDTLVTILCGK